MKEFYKKYVNWIVVILFVLFLGKSCQSCSVSNRLDWDAYNYELMIDSIQDIQDSLRKQLDIKQDSIYYFKIKNERLEAENEQLKSTNIYLKKTNNSLLHTTNNLLER